MRGYVRKKTIDELTRKAVITIGAEFGFDFEYDDPSYDPSCPYKSRIRKWIEDYKDQLMEMRDKGEISTLEYYYIIGYIEEYAFGSHFV